MLLVFATIAAALAVYRLAFMVAREEGPFDVFDRLRAAAQRLPSSPDLQPNRLRPHWIARGIGCPLCVSWWLALPAAAIVAWVAGLPLVAALGLWPAIAGAALFLYQIGGT